jgi:nucleoid DNA-binding protein/DNA-directed RNA polymerase subunit RPC12/RpoP
MTKSFTKAALVAEIAASTGLSKRAVSRSLKSLSDIAYREARNGFAIPGICKLKVVHKSASKCRNPATGKLLQIGERDVLKIVPLKRAKDAIAPRPADLVQVLDEPANTAPESQPPPKPTAPPTAADSTGMDDESGQVVFSCVECGGMIGAPASDAGQSAECPFCTAKISIPTREESHSSSHEEGDAESSTQPGADEFVTFVCATCNQEIEAPVDIIGMEVNCPSCASALNIPEFSTAADPEPEQLITADGGTPAPDRLSMTLRIDLSDLD